MSNSLQPHGYTVRGILQARILEWVAVPFSRGSSQPRDRTQVSHIAGGFLPAEPPGKPKNTEVGSLCLLPTQESNQGLLHCRQILYYFNHEVSPVSCVQLFATPGTVQSMEFSRQEYWSGWPFPSSRDLPNPGIEPRSTTLQVDSLPAEPQEKPKNTAASSISLLQRIFPTQESNWDLLYCGKILYQLSFQGSHQELNKQLKKILTIEQLALASLYH